MYSWIFQRFWFSVGKYLKFSPHQAILGLARLKVLDTSSHNVKLEANHVKNKESSSMLLNGQTQWQQACGKRPLQNPLKKALL